MTTLTTIEQEWIGFEKIVFHGITPSRCQREETRKSFYAGACAMLSMVQKTGDPDVPEADACEYLDELKQELLDFAGEVIRKAEELN